MERVKGKVYVEPISPGCNVGIIPTKKGTLIIDTPLVTRQAKRINDGLIAAGHLPVRYIGLTHYHGDHILGTSLFGDHALVIGNRMTYENMAKHKPSWVEAWAGTWTWENADDLKEMMAAQPSRPEIIFQDELTLRLGDVEVWFFPLPGHLPENTGAYLPESGILIAGDALFCDHHPYTGEGNFHAWFDSFKKMEALKADRIIPGHGRVCGYEAVEKQRRYMERMIEIHSEWDSTDSEEGIPHDAVGELLSFYPLHGRPHSSMRQRVIESIRIAGDPKF